MQEAGDGGKQQKTVENSGEQRKNGGKQWETADG